MKRILTALLLAALAWRAPVANAQALGFEVKMKSGSYVIGEPVNAAVTIENHGVRPVNISEFGPYRENRLFFEIWRTAHDYLAQRREGKVVSDLEIEKDEGAVCNVVLSDWYPLLEAGSYRIRAVLIVGDERYESPMTTFDIVPGIELASATQYLAGRPPVKRSLRLVYWTRNGKDVAFLRAWDNNGVTYGTLEIGQLLRVRKPVLQQAGDTKFYVYRQVTSEANQRAEIVSDASGVSLREQLVTLDSGVPIVESLRKAVDEAKAAKAAKDDQKGRKKNEKKKEKETEKKD